MAWSKVKKPKQMPIGWWYHKLHCEFWYYVAMKKICCISRYYIHLNKMCSYGYNLYGEKI